MKKLKPKLKAHRESAAFKNALTTIRRKNRIYFPEFNYKPPHRGIPSPEIRYINYVKIYPPQIFKLQHDSCEEVVTFIAQIKELAARGAAVEIRMEYVTEIAEGAIAMLLCVINELTDKGVYIKGTTPTNVDARDLLERSGFFAYMTGEIKEKNRKTKNKMLRTGGAGFPEVNLKQEILQVTQTVWGEPTRSPPLHTAIFEMKKNTDDHAFKLEKSIWHLAITHDDDNNVVKFSFVDNGKGILNSKKVQALKILSTLFEDKTDLLYTAFQNGIESRTGLPWRGKGLPSIFENYTDGYIRNLVVISNGVYIDFENDIKKLMPVPFSGTFYFWKIDNTCRRPTILNPAELGIALA